MRLSRSCDPSSCHLEERIILSNTYVHTANLSISSNSEIIETQEMIQALLLLFCKRSVKIISNNIYVVDASIDTWNFKNLECKQLQKDAYLASTIPLQRTFEYVHCTKRADYYGKYCCSSWRIIVIWFILTLLCPTVQADPLCDIIAATNLQSKASYSQWSCSASGTTSTSPCSSPVWTGLTCSGSTILSLNLNSAGITGNKIYEFAFILHYCCVGILMFYMLLLLFYLVVLILDYLYRHHSIDHGTDTRVK